jgi:L-alanine-DL-glutamate epimerase-like enolase superfamily enzyme
MTPYAQEYNIEHISIRDEISVLKEPLGVIDGHIAVPDGPGLGVELDEAALKELASR